MKFDTSPEELFMLIGEREFVRFKQAEEIAKLHIQIEEMSRVISDLRNEVENGKLGKSPDNDAV